MIKSTKMLCVAEMSDETQYHPCRWVFLEGCGDAEQHQQFVGQLRERCLSSVVHVPPIKGRYDEAECNRCLPRHEFNRVCRILGNTFLLGTVVAQPTVYVLSQRSPYSTMAHILALDEVGVRMQEACGHSVQDLAGIPQPPSRDEVDCVWVGPRDGVIELLPAYFGLLKAHTQDLVTTTLGAGRWWSDPRAFLRTV